eukprot:jgi/Antlo1/783/1433
MLVPDRVTSYAAEKVSRFVETQLLAGDHCRTLDQKYENKQQSSFLGPQWKFLSSFGKKWHLQGDSL